MENIRYALRIKYEDKTTKEIFFGELEKAQDLMDRIIKHQIDLNLSKVQKISITEIRMNRIKFWKNRNKNKNKNIN